MGYFEIGEKVYFDRKPYTIIDLFFDQQTQKDYATLKSIDFNSVVIFAPVSSLYKKIKRVDKTDYQSHVFICAKFDGSDISRKAYTQSEAYLIIGKLYRDGCTDITCDFDVLDNLPKGLKLL